MNRVEIPDSIAELVKIYDFITQSAEIHDLLKGLLFIHAEKFKIKEPILTKFLEVCSNLIAKKDFNISNILEQFEEAKKKLREYKLNLDDLQSKSMLELFTALINYKEI